MTGALVESAPDLVGVTLLLAALVVLVPRIEGGWLAVAGVFIGVAYQVIPAHATGVWGAIAIGAMFGLMASAIVGVVRWWFDRRSDGGKKT